MKSSSWHRAALALDLKSSANCSSVFLAFCDHGPDSFLSSTKFPLGVPLSFHKAVFPLHPAMHRTHAMPANPKPFLRDPVWPLSSCWLRLHHLAYKGQEGPVQGIKIPATGIVLCGTQGYWMQWKSLRVPVTLYVPIPELPAAPSCKSP